jgi:tetratricopeptide (TPR) repeat protein
MWAASSKWLMAFEEESRGNDAAMMRFLRESCSDFERLGMAKMACQALGTLGSRFEREGKIDSMVASFERARRISNRSRMGYQGARILTFYAAYYGRTGQLELERALLNEAIKVARRYNAGWYEVRFLRESMSFHAYLDCWDVVETLLQRVRAVERKCEGRVLGWSEIELLRVNVLDARLRMRRGDVAGAEDMFDRVMRRLPKLGLSHAYRAEDDEISFYHAEGLLANGRPREALEKLRRAFERPASESTETWLARTALLAAKISLSAGDADSAKAWLEKFDRFGRADPSELRVEWTERDALLGMARLREGDATAARAILEDGLRRLDGSVAGMDAGVASYLALSNCDKLRTLMHEVISDDADAGYGAELYWGSFSVALGSSRRNARAAVSSDAKRVASRTDADHGPTLNGFRAIARETLAGLSRLGAVHCVYLSRDDRIWRWTASQNGIRRDVLNMRSAELDSLVKRTVEGMAAGSGGGESPLAGPLRENLRTLACRLLPDEVRLSAVHPNIVFITADGSLGDLPFEALDLGADAVYEPLLYRSDVAYLRPPVRAPAVRASGTGAVLVASHPSTAGSSGFVPAERRAEAPAECDAVIARDTRAVSLSGRSATKSRVLSLWENAPYIYIAGHTEIAPEAPYLAAIPVAAASDPAPHAAQIDIADIRALDLVGCGLVALSGCSSGTPYILPETQGPSLGDAFLDAGAAAVIQTFWDVTDEDAYRIMTSFIRRWKDAPDPSGQGASTAPLIHEFCDARRSESRGPMGVRHPSYWASFSIEVTSF